jgi:hypothetical protein
LKELIPSKLDPTTFPYSSSTVGTKALFSVAAGAASARGRRHAVAIRGSIVVDSYRGLRGERLLVELRISSCTVNMRGSLVGLYNASQIPQSGEIDSPNYIHSVGLHAQSMVDRYISWPKRYIIPPLGVKLPLRQPLTDDMDMAEALPAGDVALGWGILVAVLVLC